MMDHASYLVQAFNQLRDGRYEALQEECPQSVLSTGRNFGRKTQKWSDKKLSGRTNPRSNFMQIFYKVAELF
jgi:hypothetical protein